MILLQSKAIINIDYIYHSLYIDYFPQCKFKESNPHSSCETFWLREKSHES